MKLEKDGKGRLYVDVENIRITYVPVASRDPGASWSGSDVIRVQAYKNNTDKSLHMGAELPVNDPEMFSQLIAGLCQVYVQGRES
jgi:hypothetical protein